MKKVLVCAGQGSQKLLMGKELYESNDEFKKIIERLAKTTNYPLVELLTTSKHDINEIGNTQIALVAFEYALGKLVMDKVEFTHFYGLSLGEIVALALNGAILEKDLLLIVEKRIEAMKKCLNDDSAMLAVIDTNLEKIKTIVSEFDNVYLANDNSTNQIVLASNKKTIETLKQTLANHGFKRAVLLNVKGPFHTKLMQEATIEFAKSLEKFEFTNIDYKTISNYSGNLYSFESLKSNLANHLSNPVLFTQITKQFNSTDLFVEIAPSKILAKLIKETIEANVITINNQKTLEQFIGEYNE